MFVSLHIYLFAIDKHQKTTANINIIHHDRCINILFENDRTFT